MDQGINTEPVPPVVRVTPLAQIRGRFGGVAPDVGAMTPDERVQFDERAAIVEYDGGLSRAEAERLAWAEIEAGRQAGGGDWFVVEGPS